MKIPGRVGTTLVEVIVMFVLLIAATGAAYNFWAGGRKTLERVDDHLDLQASIRTTMSQMLAEVKQAAELLHPPPGRREEGWPILSYVSPTGSIVAIYEERDPGGGKAKLVRVDTDADSYGTVGTGPAWVRREILADGVELFRVFRRGHRVDLQLHLVDPRSQTTAYSLSGISVPREFF